MGYGKRIRPFVQIQNILSNESTLNKLTDDGTNLLFNGSIITNNSKGIEILSADPTGTDLYEGRMWIVSATQPVNSAPSTPVISLVSTGDTSVTIKLTTASTDAEDGTISTYEIYKDSVLVTTVTLALNGTYQLTGLANGTTYSLTAKAKDSVGLLSIVSNTVNATTTTPSPVDTTPPVVTATPTAGTYTSIQNVTLSSEAGATIYYTTDGTTPTYPISGTTQIYSSPISISLTSTLRYIGRDTAGNVSVPVATTYTINLADTTAPYPVGSLTAGTPTSNNIPITWALSSSNDIVNYEIAYSSNGGSTYTVASNLINASSTSYTVTGLSANTPYIVRIVAIDGSGNRSTGVTVNATTSAVADTTPPVAPSGISITNILGTSMNVSWVASSSTDVDHYRLDYVISGQSPFTSVTVTSTSYVLTGLLTNTKYLIQIYAVDTSGNVSTVDGIQATTSNILLQDNFDDNTKDTTLWTYGTPDAHAITGSGIFEENGKMAIKMGSDGTAWSGSGNIISKVVNFGTNGITTSVDFGGLQSAYTVQPTMKIILGTNNYALFYFDSVNPHMNKNVAGVTTSDIYADTNSSTNIGLYENKVVSISIQITSTNLILTINGTQKYSVAHGMTLISTDQVKVQFSAAVSNTTTSLITSTFDNFKLIAN